jgi:hypothetical protein
MVNLRALFKSALLIFALLSVHSSCGDSFPYLGLDVQQRFMGFRRGYGDSTLHKVLPQSNIHLGFRVNKYFAIEAGYEETFKSKRKVTLETGDLACGTPIQEMTAPVTFQSKIKIQGVHVSLAVFYPLTENLELFSSFGFSVLKGAATRETLFMMGNIPHYFKRTFVGRKQVVRVTLGSQYWINSSVAIRGYVGIMDTHKLSILSNDNIRGNHTPMVFPKDSKLVGLGLIIVF